MKFWSMSVEDAEEFFNRCLAKEATTQKERLAILDEMMAERSNMQTGEFENEYIEKELNHKRIIGIRYHKGSDDSSTIRGN